ncbi:hypothetical protein [Streptomyces sp. MMG1533]|uniref:hypothetical protein n=1 Tax=Streptomyces sp. MMG1533 TaxID=1415546 RepID=UPI00131E0912|nr:hypothetical protein [Streptomyces sp. MMG1533]
MKENHSDKRNPASILNRAVIDLNIEIDVTHSRALLQKVHRFNKEDPAFFAAVGLIGITGGVFRALGPTLIWVADAADSMGIGRLAHSAYRYGHLIEAASDGPVSASKSLAIAITLGLLLSGAIAILVLVFLGRWSPTHRYALNVSIAHALSACATLQQRPALLKKVATIRRIDQFCCRVERNILRVPYRRGTIPRRSPRRASVAHHASLVAGALRMQLRELDRDPDVASSKLSAMLAEIGEQYAKGRIGALLDEEALVDVVPVSKARTTLRESVHVAAVILSALAATLIANALMPESVVSDSLRPWFLVGTAAVSAILIGGWPRVSRLLEVFPGK